MIDTEEATFKIDNEGYFQWHHYLDVQECDLVEANFGKLIKLRSQSTSINGDSLSVPNVIESLPSLYYLATEPRLNNFLLNIFARNSYENEFPYQLSRFQYRSLTRPCDAQVLHQDARLPGVQPLLSLHCFIYLTDVKIEDGATQLVPKSHLINRYPGEDDRDQSISVEAAKGDMLIINSSLWHGSGKKHSFSERPIIALAYNRWWIRQQFQFPYILRSAQISLTEKQKQIFGFYNYPPISASQRISARGDLPF